MRPSLRPRQRRPPTRRSFSVRQGVISSFLPIIVTLVLLPPIALASLPDPSWIVGVYDAADGDDVVILVYETAGVEAMWLKPIPPPYRSHEVVLFSYGGGFPGFPARQFTRGPPSP